MGDHGNMNMNKNGGGNANGTATVLNEYMTWSVALNAAKNNEAIIKIMEDKPLSKTDESELTFGHFFEMKDTEGNPAKAVDLGGGDQEKILNNSYVDTKQKTVDKYSAGAENKEMVFTTGGSDDKRLANLGKLKDNGVNPNVSALTLDNETALTAVSYYDYAQELLKDKAELHAVCGIPIGSTDIHLVIYRRGGGVETGNLGNYNDKTYTDKQQSDLEDLQTKLNGIKDQTVLYVFGGSARYVMGEMDLNSINNQTDLYDKLDESENKKKGDLIKVLKKLNFNFDTTNGTELMAGGSKKGTVSAKAFEDVYFGASNGNKGAAAQGNGNQGSVVNVNNQRSELVAQGNGNGTRAAAQQASQGGKRRRTRKVNKNRRKTVKAKNMRRKNKSSKGKKSKTSRRR